MKLSNGGQTNGPATCPNAPSDAIIMLNIIGMLNTDGWLRG